jgi:hypothetical protein
MAASSTKIFVWRFPGRSSWMLAKERTYYITAAEQTPEVQAPRDTLIQTRVGEDGDTLNPESITVMDPACGSGHILVGAYDVAQGHLPGARLLTLVVSAMSDGAAAWNRGGHLVTGATTHEELNKVAPTAVEQAIAVLKAPPSAD